MHDHNCPACHEDFVCDLGAECPTPEVEPLYCEPCYAVALAQDKARVQ